MSRFMRWSVIVLPMAALSALHSASADAVTIVNYSIPGATSTFAITSGPGGDPWFTDQSTSQLRKIRTTGQVTGFPVMAGAICAGPDGNLWFAQDTEIGKITPAGSVTYFAYAGSRLNGIAPGADGNLYFTETDSKIGRITPQGTMTEFPIVSTGGLPTVSTQVPDGNPWFTVHGQGTANTIGTITPAGTVSKFPVPSSASYPASITAGSDGNLWYGKRGCDYCDPSYPSSTIGKMTPAGIFTEYVTPANDSDPAAIARGFDGNL